MRNNRYHFSVLNSHFSTPCVRLELFKESQIAAQEPANIVDIELIDRDTLDAEAAGEAAEFLGIVAAVSQHAGVDHAAAAQLEPAGVFTDATAVALAVGARYIQL